MAYERRSYSGKARATTLLAAIDEVVTSFTVADASTWLEGPGYTLPLGHSGYFVVSIDYGTSTEEKVLCSAVNTSTGVVTVVTRGYDGLKPAATGPGNVHALGATVVPVFSAAEAIEANYAVNETVGTVTTAGDMLVAAGANNLARLAAGSSGSVLQVSSGVVGWSAAGASGYLLQSTGSGVQWTTGIVPSILAYQAANSALALTVNTNTKVQLDTTSSITGASGEQPVLTTSGTNKGRVTISKNGVYQINGCVSTGLSTLVSTDYAQASLQVSIGGTTNRFAGPRSRAIAGYYGDASISNTFVFSANDWVELDISCNQASVVQGNTTPYCTFMSVVYIGPKA